MRSFLFFICFTFTALLYRIFPSHITVWFSMMLVTFLSVFFTAVKLSSNSGRRRWMGEGSPMADETWTVWFMFFVYTLAAFGELFALFVEWKIEPIPPESFMWTVYVITLIVNYVLPVVIYLYRRTRFYLDIREKAENHGWEMSADMLEFIFCGRRNVHNITIETQSGTQTIGILGSVSAMEYIIEDGMIKSKRMPTFEKGVVFLYYGGEKKKKLPFLYRIEGCGTPLPEHIGRTYLMIQPNAFVVSNNFLVDIGEEVEGMLLLNMETGMKVVHE